ncbi:MAG: DUF86 domain-containing protein [Planctomycetes bacterium]|nr:DUF86 domain-containing protein [Planctomycetota bacterium]
MTDHDLIAKLLAYIETCVRELRTEARLERLETDVRELRFVEHTLQLAIQAAMDAASHVVSAERLGEPVNNRELFELLAKAGRLDANLMDRLRRMVGLRNVLVHGYTRVDPTLLRQAVTDHLDDLLAFATALRRKA